VCTLAYYPLELVAGRYSTDHNDLSFLFYVTASIWAWFEYQHTQNKYYLVLIGLFSGCAVLENGW
jgi:4-amino-4-deoxy-L-arabinose transferase